MVVEYVRRSGECLENFPLLSRLFLSISMVLYIKEDSLYVRIFLKFFSHFYTACSEGSNHASFTLDFFDSGWTTQAGTFLLDIVILSLPPDMYAGVVSSASGVPSSSEFINGGLSVPEGCTGRFGSWVEDLAAVFGSLFIFSGPTSSGRETPQLSIARYVLMSA